MTRSRKITAEPTRLVASTTRWRTSNGSKPMSRLTRMGSQAVPDLARRAGPRLEEMLGSAPNVAKGFLPNGRKKGHHVNFSLRRKRRRNVKWMRLARNVGTAVTAVGFAADLFNQLNELQKTGSGERRDRQSSNGRAENGPTRGQSSDRGARRRPAGAPSQSASSREPDNGNGSGSDQETTPRPAKRTVAARKSTGRRTGRTSQAEGNDAAQGTGASTSDSGRAAPARKTAARKTAASTTPARKTAARKTPARKSAAPAKKAPAARATTGRATARKAPATKKAAKRAPARQAATTRSAS